MYIALRRRMSIAGLLIVLAMLVPHGEADLAGSSAFSFSDATAEVGLEKYVKGALNHAVAWGDFDGDGRLDLFLGNLR
jgi:hypothetical protein